MIDKCPNCGDQAVRITGTDGLPLKGCPSCLEEWEYSDTFAVREYLHKHDLGYAAGQRAMRERAAECVLHAPIGRNVDESQTIAMDVLDAIRALPIDGDS